MEKKKSRTYTEEFRKQAVQLANEMGSVKKSAKQLGVPPANVYSWKIKLSSGQLLAGGGENNGIKGAFPRSAAPSAEEEVQRLRKENAELKKVNYILKAAAAIFTRDHLS